MITQKDREREAEHNRRLMVAEADADRKHRKNLQAIKDKMDMFGDDCLNLEEKEIVRLFHDFFFPEEG